MKGAPGSKRQVANHPLLMLTQLVGSPLLNPAGEHLGLVEDFIVRLADGGYPPVTGLKVRVGGRQLFVGANMLAKLAPDDIRLGAQKLDLGRFERRPGEVLLREDILDRRLINVAAGRAMNANDLALAQIDGRQWRLIGVDPSPRGALRRLLPQRMRRKKRRPAPIVNWNDIQPFVGRVPTAKLLIPLQRLKRLHPAQIADIVERTSHEEGEEIIDAVAADPELTADVFEELDTDHQVEFLRAHTNEEAAAILGRMAPDDAADLLGELDQQRRLRVLNLMPASQQHKVRALLQYNASSAGGMMSPDYVALPRGTTQAQALERVRADDKVPPQLLTAVFVIEPDGRLVGAAPTIALLKGNPQGAIETAAGLSPARVRVDDDLPEIAMLMADYNLTVVPVTDRDGRLVGAISVDDLLEAVLPNDWRRRAEASQGG